MSAPRTPAPGHSPTPVNRLRQYTAVVLGFAALSFTAVQLVPAIGEPWGLRGAALTLGTLAALALTLALIPAMMRGRRHAAPHPAWLVTLGVGTFALWWLASTAPTLDWHWATVAASSLGVIACFLPLRWRFALIPGGLLALSAVRVAALAATGVPLTWESFAGDPVTFLLIGATQILAPFAYLTTAWTYTVVTGVDRARRLAAELAIARERLRFASDLHDIQGHHLQVIALKSELAERLLDRDPAGAAAELAAIRGITQEALEDTRAVVNDYRTVTVPVEARNAASLLRSAGVDCIVSIDDHELPEPTGTALALTIREATTNLLRHSRASTARIILSNTPAGVTLTVINDGAHPLTGTGTGLRGLNRRLTELGGTLSSGRDGETFTLIARVPHAATPRPTETGATP